jgi:hypothetical protein
MQDWHICSNFFRKQRRDVIFSPTENLTRVADGRGRAIRLDLQKVGLLSRRTMIQTQDPRVGYEGSDHYVTRSGMTRIVRHNLYSDELAV